MSINNNPTINTKSNYNILGTNGNDPKINEQIVERNQKTLFNYGNEVGTNLAKLDTLKNHTVWTYGMQNADGTDKKGFKWLSQLVDNLFHLSENLERDTLDVLEAMRGSAAKLYTSLNFKFTLSDVKDLSMENIDESIQQMETVLQRVNDAKTHNATIETFETLSKQITDIINQMKHLKLYAAEGKISGWIKAKNFKIDNKFVQTIEKLIPKDPKGEESFPSTVNYKEIQTKYNQLHTFTKTLSTLNTLKDTDNVKSAHAVWSQAKIELKEHGGESEVAQLFEKELDNLYTQKIKELSQDIKDMKECIKNGGDVKHQSLQNVRRLCQTITEHHKAEELSLYIDDLEKGVNIGNELTKLSNNLCVLKDRSTSQTLENLNVDHQKMENQITELEEQLEQISDNEITKALRKDLLDAKKELSIAQNRIALRKDLGTLKQDIDNLKQHPPAQNMQKTVFDDIETFVTNIEGKINASDEHEKTILQNFFGKELRGLKEAFQAIKQKMKNQKISQGTDKLNNIFNKSKSDGLQSIKSMTDAQKAQGAALQTAEKKLKTALRQLKDDFKEADEIHTRKIYQLNQSKTSPVNRDLLENEYKGLQLNLKATAVEKYQQTLNQTINTLKEAHPNIPKDTLDQLESKYRTLGEAVY